MFDESFDYVVTSRAYLDGVQNAGDKINRALVGLKYVDGKPVVTALPGKLRGLIRPGMYVSKGLKIADVDPRGVSVDHMSISDKARAVAGGVLEAVDNHFAFCDNQL